MGLAGFRAKNHPQQVQRHGACEATDDRATPWKWFNELNTRFRFTLDAAATAANAKCARFFDKQADGLRQPWAGERVWCNPPYSDLAAWVQKAWAEDQRGSELIVLLVPANRTEQAWWQDHIEPHRDREDSPLRTEFLRHRRRFIKPGTTEIRPNERPPFGVCLLIWGAEGVSVGHHE